MVNLYQVMPRTYEYSYFVFAESRNEAKALCVDRNASSTDGDENYINLRCKTLKKDVDESYYCTVIEAPEDKGYEYVKMLGFDYYTNEEWEKRN